MTTSRKILQNKDSISNDHFEALLRKMQHQRDWREEVIRRYREIVDYAWERGGEAAVRETVALCRQLDSPWLGTFTEQARVAAGYAGQSREVEPAAIRKPRVREIGESS